MPTAQTTTPTTMRPMTASVTTSPRPMRFALYAMTPYTSRRVRAPPPISRAREEHLAPQPEKKLPARPPPRRYGFRGGLVPGVIVYAYLTEPLVAGLGEAWLARGTAHARFRRPIVDAEEVTVTGDVTGRDAR